MEFDEYESAIRDIGEDGWKRLSEMVYAYARSSNIPDWENMAAETISLTISGQRPWNFNDVKIEAHLIKVFKGLRFNWLRAQTVRQRVAPDLIAIEQEKARRRLEARTYPQQMRDEYKLLQKTDPKLADFYIEVLEAVIEHGCKDQRQIARVIGISESTFTERKKRVGSILLADGAGCSDSKDQGRMI